MNGTDPTLELLWKKIGADTIASLDEFTKDMQDSQDLRRSVWKKIGADKIDSFEQFEKDFGFVTDAEPQPVEPKKQAYEFDWKAAAKKDLSQSHLQFSPKGSIQEYGVNSQGRLIDKQARPKTEKSLSDIAALNPNTPFGQQFGSEADPLQQYKTINETQKLAKGFKTKQKEIEHFKQSIGDNPSEADIVELNKQVLELLSNYEDNKDFLKEAVNTLNEQSDLKKEKALSLIPAKEFYNNNFAKTFDGPLASLSGDFAEWMTDSKQQELFKGWSTDPDFNAKKKGFVIQQFINSKQKEIEAGIESARTEDEREAYQAYQNLLNSSYATFLNDNPKERERLVKQIEKQRELQVQPEDSAFKASTKTVKAGLKSAYNTGVNLLVDVFAKLPVHLMDFTRGKLGGETDTTSFFDRYMEVVNNLVDNVTFDLPELKDEAGIDPAGAAATTVNIVGSMLGLRAVAGFLSKLFSAKLLGTLKGLSDAQKASILVRAERFQKGEQFLSGLITYAPRTIEAYKEQGLSNSDALSLGLLSSGISSVIEMISPGIPFGTSLTKDAYLKLAKEGATRGTILKEVGKGLVTNIVNEVPEEALDDVVNQVILPSAYNEISGQNLKETSLSEYINEDALTTVFLTTVAAAFFGGGLTVLSGQFQEIDGFVDAVKNIDTRIVTEKIQNWVESGQITTEQGSDFLQFIQKQKSEVAKNEGLEASKTTVEQKKPVEKVATGQQVVEDQELTGTEAGQPPTGTIATKTGGEGEIDPTLETESLLSNEQLKDEQTPESEVETFELVENEGQWKATTKTYKGREIGNWVNVFLDKKQQKEYDKIRDDVDKYGTKEQAEANLKKLQDFESKNKEAFVKAKEQIDNFKQAEEQENKAKKERQNIYDKTANQLSQLSDLDFETLINLIDKDVKSTLEKRFGDRVERKPLFKNRISEDYHADKAAGKETELTKAVESLLSKEQTPTALRDVESTAKALEGKYKKDAHNLTNWTLDKSKRLKELQDKEDDNILSKNEEKEFEGLMTEFDLVDVDLLPKEHEKTLGFLFDVPHSKNTPKAIAEAYHKAKAEGTNPELVKAVEELLGKKPSNKSENKPTISKEQQPVVDSNSEVEAKKADVESTAKALEGVDATFSADLSDSKLSVDERKQSAKKQIKDNGITNDASYTLISRALEKVDGLSVNNIFDLAKRVAKLDNKPILVEHIAEAIQYEVGRVEGEKDTFSLSIEDAKDVLLNWSKDAEPKETTKAGSVGVGGEPYLVDSVFIEKINPDGENTALTERQEDSIDKAVQMAIDAGQTAEQIAGTLNGLGYAFRNPLGMQAAQQTLINYIKNRINGTDTRNINEFAKDTKAGSGGVVDVEGIKGKYVKDGFEIQYERPDYIELFKKTDNSTNVGEFETKKIGEKITIALNEDGTIEVLSADFNINGGGLSGQAGKNKFYDLGEYKPVEQFLKETTKAPKVEAPKPDADVSKQENQDKPDGTDTKKQVEEKTAEKAEEKVIYTSTSATLPHRIIERNGERVVQQKSKGEWKDVKNKQISEAVLENFGLKPEPKKEDKEESFNDAFEKALKEQGGVVSDIDITKRNLDAKGTTNYNKIVPRTKVQKAVMGTIKKLASKLIGVKTYVHESIDSYANALSEAGYPAERAKSSNAFYDGKSIHVFLGSPGLKNNTFLHEGVHAVISAKLKENRAVLTKWVSQLYTDSALFRKYFTEYAGREYDSKSLDPALVDEEAVTEFLADKVFEKMLEDANTDRNLFDNLKEWFRNLLRRLGYKADVINPVLSTDEDVFSFADRLADLFKTSAVQTTDINKGTIRFQDEGDFSQAELNNKKERLRTTIRNKIPEINSGKIPHNAIIASAKKQGIPEEETLEILKQEIYGFTPDVTRLVHAETKAILKKIGTKTESEKTGLEDRVYQAIQRGLITDNSFEGIEAVLAQKELNGGRINGVEITALQYAQQQVQEAANEVDNKMTEARNSWTKSYGIENDLGYRALENEFRFLNFLKIDLLAHSIQVGSQKGADLQSLQQYLTDAQKYAKKLLSRMVDKITPKEKAEFGAKATEVEKASEQYAKALEKSQTDKDQKLKSGAEKEVSEQSKKSGKKTKYDDLTTDELDKRISKLLEGNDLLEGTVLFQDNDEKPNGGGDLNKNIELYKLLRARANKVIKELQKKGTFPTADEVYLKMKDLFPKLSKDAFYKAMVFGSEGAINEATKYAQRERANLTNFIKRKLKADLLAKAKMEKLLRGEKLTPEDEEQYSKAATDALNMALQIGLSTNELLQLSEDLNKLNLALDKSRAADMAAKEIKAALAKIDDEITKRAENRKKNYEKKLKDIQERLDKLANGDPDGLDGLVVPNQDKLVSFELTQARKRYQNEREKLFVFANYLEHKDRIDKANTVLGKMYQHYMAQGGIKALASSLFEVSRSMKAMFDLSSFFVQAIGWTVPSAIPGIRVLNTKGLNKDEIRTLQNKSLSKWSLHLGGNVFANWNIPITANAFRNAVDIIAKGLSIKKDSFKLAAIRHNEDIKSTVFYDLAERAGVDLSEVGDISQREDFFHSDFFKTMANLPTSTFSENKKAGGLLKAIWKQTGTTAVTAAKGIQLVKEISEEIYIYSLNEFKVNQFRQTVMAAGAINDLDYQKFIARQINIQFGTAKIASSDESALTFLDNNFWKYVFFAPHLFMNRIRQVFNYGTSPVRLAAGVITGNKKAQKEEAYKIIHTTKALASYGALMYLAELLGLEWDDDPRSSTFMKLKYGDKTLDMTGGFAPIWKMFGRTTYYAGQNEKTPGKAIRSVVGPIMKYMPFIGVEDYFTSDVPASLKGSLAMSNFRDEYVRFLTYKLHPSVSLGVVTGANYFATGDLTDAIGKPIYSEIVAQLGGDPSGWLSTTLGMASHMFMPIFLDQLSDDILKYTDKKPETFDDYVYSFWGNGMFAFMGANTTDYEDLMKAQEIQNYFDSSKVFNGRNPFKMLRFEDLKIYDGGATKKVPDWMLNNTIYKSMLKDYAKAYYAEDLQQRIKAGTSPKEMERLIFGQNGIRKKAMRKAVNEIERQYGKDNKPK